MTKKKIYQRSLVWMLGFLFLFQTGKSQSTLMVTNLNDNGAGSLRQMVQFAFAGDTIRFAVRGVITLTSGPIAYTKNLVIDGPVTDSIMITQNNSQTDTRLFNITGGNSHISRLILDGAKGYSLGGGIFFNGNLLELEEVTFRDCEGTSSGYDGSGLYAVGGKAVIRNTEFLRNGCNDVVGFPDGGAAYFDIDSLIMEDCVFDSNYLYTTNAGFGGVKGGAVWMDAEYAEINHCLFINNSIWAHKSTAGNGYGGYGGAIYSYRNSPLTPTHNFINNCEFKNNKVHGSAPNSWYNRAYGGAIYATGPGTLSIDSTYISHCTAYDENTGYGKGVGGGIAGGKTLTIRNTTIDSCYAIEGGTAIHYGGFTVIMENCNILNNKFNYARPTYTNGSLFAVEMVAVSITSSNIGNNLSGIYCERDFLLNKSSVFGHTNPNSKALECFSPNSYPVNLRNSTFNNNRFGFYCYECDTLLVNNCSFMGDSSGASKAILIRETSLTAKNNVFDLPFFSSQPQISWLDNFSISSLGANVIRDTSAAAYFTHPTDLSATDPRLNTFALHGGTTYCFDLQATSPAIDLAGNDTIPDDQRGFLRTGLVDAGAFEGGASNPNGLVVQIVTGDTSVCEGQPVVLAVNGTGQGTITYQWYFNSAVLPGETNSSLSFSSVVLGNNGDYSCVITNGIEVDSAQIELTVNPSPTANAGSPQTICEGQSVTLTATGGTTYNWSNGLGAGQTQSVSPTATTTYTVTVTDGNSCTDTDDVVVTVNAAPTANAGTNQSICAGQSANLSATGGTTYTWSNGLGAGASQTVSPTATTTYTVTVTDGNNCTDTDDVVVTVNALPTANAGANQSICAGQSATLSASGGTTYTWSNGLGAGQTQSVSPTATTTYTVTVTNGSNCTDTDDVVVTVNALPTANAGANQAICAGQSANLSATGGTTYAWSNGLGSGQTQSVSPTATTTYTVTVTDGNNCTDTDDVIITVNPLPTANAGADQAICAGQTANLSATGGSTYTWDNGLGAGAAQSVAPTATTTYTVTVTDGNNCTDTDDVVVTVNPLPTANAGTNQTICAGQTANLSASGGSTYTWSNGLGAGASQSVAPTATTTYTVTVTDGNNCTDTDDVIVTVNPLPTANAGADQAICAGQSANLSASGGSIYSWSNGLGAGQTQSVTPTATTTYTVTVTDGNNCTDTDDVIIVVNPLPTANAGADQTICEGQSANLSATGGSIYNWSNGLGAGQSQTVSPIATTIYTVTVTDGNNCTDTDDVVVTVNPLPTANAGADQTICEGQSANLSASGGFTYSWDQGLGSGASHSVSPTATTTYSVTVTDGNNCSASDNVTITVNPLPNVSFTGLDTNYCSTDPVENLVGSPAGGSFNGNGVSGNGFNPAIAGVGTHTIQYVYTDNNNCTNNAIQQTTVSVCSGLSEAIESPAFTVFPVPATEQLFIRNDSERRENLKVSLFDHRGRKVLERSWTPSERFEMDVRGLSNGVYLLNIEGADVQSHHKVVILGH